MPAQLQTPMIIMDTSKTMGVSMLLAFIISFHEMILEFNTCTYHDLLNVLYI